ENSDPVKMELYQEYVFKFTNSYDSIIRVFEKGFTKYYALKYETRIVGSEEVGKSLKRNEVLIEYSISDTSLISFLITRDKFMVRRECIDSTFWLSVNSLQTSLMNSDFSNNIEQEYVRLLNSSNKLYKHLIGPFEDYIKKKQLIVVPDGALAYLPFEILLSNNPGIKKVEFHTLPYLLKSNPINYSYSATLLLNEKAAGRFSKTKLLAFAPKYLNASLLGNKSEGFLRSEFGGLNPLPFSRQEVETIMELSRGTILIDEEATETQFKEMAPHFDILHLAMHTLIDNVEPMYSKLAFTYSEMDTLNDGFLNINELYNLQLNAKLAVLSSCNSGSGKLQKGEGIMSIARGFMYAGCPSVVMTLWEVEDKSGSEIMEKFYRYLKKGHSKNRALRNAKLEFLEEANLLKSHPYFWSAYITLGDNSPVYAALWPGKIVPVFFILLLTFLFIWSKKNRKSV
ncbi:MAG: CHAT domain-containing protein, partial [Bacteroidales bacterium]|nr:CHAT domain-containing protein [Bacteroidales bacterium]